MMIMMMVMMTIMMMIRYGTHNHAKWTAQHGDNVFQYIFEFKGPYGYC